jgi:hypothetical protein
VWLDNFSKTRGMQMPSIDAGTWADCLWTGRALREHKGGVLTMDVLFDDDDEIIPAMPEDPLAFMPKFVKLFKKACVTTADMYRHASSCVVRMDVRNVPLKPLPAMVGSPRHQAALTDGHDNLNSMVPDCLLKINIGSNIGLARILRDHYEAEEQHINRGCNRYTAFNMDCNIFDRTFKVTPLSPCLILDQCVCSRCPWVLLNLSVFDEWMKNNTR